MEKINESVGFKKDGWLNLLTGMGMATRDKRLNTTFGTAYRFDRQTLTELYRGDGLGSRIINVVAGDMVREWIDVSGDPEGFVSMKLSELSAKVIFEEALIWDRLFGGSVILMYVDDGQELEEEVNEEQIRDIKGFQVYDRHDITWSGIDLYDDPKEPNYGTPRIFTINNISTGATFRAHESRLLRFDGEFLPAVSRAENNGWGDPIMQKIYDRLRGVADGYAGAENLITEFVIGVLTIKNLQSLIASPEGTQKLKDRMNILDMSKHIMNSYLLDENEEFNRVAAAGVSGMGDLLDKLIDGLVAVSGIPRVKLFGEQTKGLGSQAAGNIRMYYDEVAALQERKLQKPIEKLVRFIFKSKDYEFHGVEPESWNVTFNTLWQPTEEETSDTRKKVAETDKLYYDMGMPGEVIITNRFGGEGYSMETTLPDEVVTAFEDVIKSKTFIEEEEEVPLAVLKEETGEAE